MDYSPGILRGDIGVCIGITEPQAGSDVARTRRPAQKTQDGESISSMLRRSGMPSFFAFDCQDALILETFVGKPIFQQIISHKLRIMESQIPSWLESLVYFSKYVPMIPLA